MNENEITTIFNINKGNALLYLISKDEELKEIFLEMKDTYLNPVTSKNNPLHQKYGTDGFYFSIILCLLEDLIKLFPNVIDDVVKQGIEEDLLLENIRDLYSFSKTGGVKEIVNLPTEDEEEVEFTYTLRVKCLLTFLTKHSPTIYDKLHHML